MSGIFNIYCDESCHLERDGQRAMVLGAVWCPAEKAREINQRVREIKKKHGLAPNFESKWTKVSPSKQAFYMELLDYFFDDDDLHLRALIVPDKSLINHAIVEGQDHETWYYKMTFNLLKVVFDPASQYRIYIDIKDTRGQVKITKLREVLCNSQYDFSRRLIERVQRVRSHEIEIMQIADLLIGALSYLHRGLTENKAKVALIERMKHRSRYSLMSNTLYQEKKVNILVWRAQGNG